MESHDKTISPDDVFKPDERFKSGKTKIRYKNFDDEHIQERLAHHLRAARIERAISLEDAAEDFGVDSRTWLRYENGQRSMPATFLCRVLAAWDIEPVAFLFDPACRVYTRGTKVPQKERVNENAKSSK